MLLISHSKYLKFTAFYFALIALIITPQSISLTSAQNSEDQKFEITKEYQLNGTDRTYIDRDFTIWGIAYSEAYLYLSIVWETGPSGILILDHDFNYIKEVYLIDGVPFYPLGIDYHRDRLFVVGFANSSIIVMDEVGNFIFEFGEYGSSPGQFKNHQDVAANNQLIYVADTLNGRIQMFTHQGEYIDTTTELLPIVKHIAVFDTGFFTTSRTAKPLHKFDLRGEVEYEWGSMVQRFGDAALRTSAGEFNSGGFGGPGGPNGLAVYGQYMIVGDYPSGRIQIFDLFGNFIKNYYVHTEDRGVFNIWDLEMDAERIYVVDVYNQALVIYNYDTEVENTFEYSAQATKTQLTTQKESTILVPLELVSFVGILSIAKKLKANKPKT